MGKAINVRKNFKALGFRSPHWQIYNYFADKIKYTFKRNNYDELRGGMKKTVKQG